MELTAAKSKMPVALAKLPALILPRSLAEPGWAPALVNMRLTGYTGPGGFRKEFPAGFPATRSNRCPNPVNVPRTVSPASNPTSEAVAGSAVSTSLTPTPSSLEGPEDGPDSSRASAVSAGTFRCALSHVNPQVHEHVAPLQAEAGQEFVDKLMAQGQKNKTPASDAGSSQAPPAKRFRTEAVAGKVVAMRRHKGKRMPTATGPALLGSSPRLCRLGQDLNSSSSFQFGTVGAGNTSPLGGATSWGCGPLHRQISARRRTSLPSKKKKTSSKTAPEASAPATSPPPPPETSAPEATGPTPTPPPTQEPSAPPPPANLKITDFLKPGASRGKATDGSSSSSSQPLVLHVGPAAVVVQDKPSGLLGRIVELKRGGQDLGPLLPYAQRWNDADISAATRGLGKDRLPAPDPAGPRSTEEHFTRLKRAVKEFDSAWYDATANVVSTADARKALFEELLWEHRSLAEAHSKCQAVLEATIEALKAQVATLQAEKKQLIRDHQKALEAQKEISRELKDQAIQAGVRHAEELKAAEAAAEARLNEALEDAGNANVVLQAELEEGAKALKTAEGKAAKAHKAAAEEARKAQKAAESEVARLKAEQKEYDLLVTRTDALALRLFPDSCAHAIKKLFKTLPGPAVPETFSLISNCLKGACMIREWWQLATAPERTPRCALPAPGIRSWTWTPSSACVKALPLTWIRFLPLSGRTARTTSRSTLNAHLHPPSEDVKDYLSEEEEDEGEDVPPPTPDAGAAPPEAPAA
ncbi:hypothetical protein QYE76_010985 [Lolium multiflorum]|uniref:Uncharacterized protein n=1 Tax=Lolium multiflorum TaxID=4521 RepID=A0AAD8TYA8_LOLMU|nr:hypothetical protein QYE76_010985 [Lolium multiflorum]